MQDEFMKCLIYLYTFTLQFFFLDTVLIASLIWCNSIQIYEFLFLLNLLCENLYAEQLRFPNSI